MTKNPALFFHNCAYINSLIQVLMGHSVSSQMWCRFKRRRRPRLASQEGTEPRDSSSAVRLASDWIQTGATLHSILYFINS